MSEEAIPMHSVRRLLKCESGATSIEYALIASAIALVIIVAVNGIGTKLKATFTAVNSNLA